MKKIQLYIAIAMFIITTFLLVVIPLLFEQSNGMWSVLISVALVGYLLGYLLLDKYITMVSEYNYFRGFTKGKGLYESSPRPRFNLSKNNK